ncbi:MAG: P-II family nitrogen regulator [Methanomassiliicoccales archaeon]|jgi:nitrogen regulatory protein PII 2
MKEIMALVRMNKTSATKKALVETGVAGFTAVKVLGRGKPVPRPEVLEEQKRELMKMAHDDINDPVDTEHQVTSFLDGSRPFPRRLFTILAHDEDVPRIVSAITMANKSENAVGDGIILVLPVVDVVRVRTGESGEAAIW